MKKILFFIETLEGGGAELVLCNLVNHMDQTRFNITVQTVWPCDASKHLVPGVRYQSVYPSASKRNRIRYRMEAASGLLYWLHVKDDYDIECAYLEMGATKVMAASTNKRAKKLAWVHCDLKKKVSDTKAFVKKTAKWYRKFDKVVCVSRNVRESFVELYGEIPESVVVYNTIADEEILRKSGAPVQTPQKRKTTLVAVGRLAPEKGFDRLLRVSKQLKEEGREHDLWIVGEGPERSKLESLIQQYKLTDSVKLLGFCENPYPIMRMADIYVCSSWYEGLSTTVIEALLLGKPIVTTDCGGMDELLGDSEYGLITANNTEDLHNGLKRLLSNPKLGEAYANKALERGKLFTASALVKQTEEFLGSLLE